MINRTLLAGLFTAGLATTASAADYGCRCDYGPSYGRAHAADYGHVVRRAPAPAWRVPGYRARLVHADPYGRPVVRRRVVQERIHAPRPSAGAEVFGRAYYRSGGYYAPRRAYAVRPDYSYRAPLRRYGYEAPRLVRSVPAYAQEVNVIRAPVWSAEPYYGVAAPRWPARRVYDVPRWDPGYALGGYAQGGYAQGGYVQGGYAQGGYAQGGYAQGGYGAWQGPPVVYRYRVVRSPYAW